jgi:hypothetical protein
MLNLIIDPIRYFLNSYFPKKDSKGNKLDSKCTLNNFKIGNSDVNISKTINSQANEVDSASDTIKKCQSIIGLIFPTLPVANEDLSTKTGTFDDFQSNTENVQNGNSTSEKDEKLPVKILRLVLKKIGLNKLFEKYVDDPRQKTCAYSLPSLLIMSVIMHVLRFPSRNGFHDSGNLSEKFKENIAKLAGAKTMPCAKTFEDCFIQLNSEDLEPILPELFRKLLRSKFFNSHPEFKGETIGSCKNTPFTLAIDGQITHTYTDESQHPCINCPYCLSRTRGKKTWYVHYDVVLSVIGEKGFQMPLFIYRIKKQQLSEGSSENMLKQECELLALPHLLEKFRSEFPRLKVIVLLDSLYANGPAIATLKKYHCDYAIVRKEGSLRSLNSDIEGQKKLITPIKRRVIEKRWKKKQEVYVFPDMSHQGNDFTVIDLVEKCHTVASSRFAKVTKKATHWQWICNLKVDSRKVFKVVHQARLRWPQEDFFNTMQHRGYNLLHDFSRNPTSQSTWHLLLFIAFVISTLMQLSRLGCLSRRSAAIINWIGYLKSILMVGILDFNESLDCQLRFGYNTS